jgi:hypothetical protein
MPLIVEILTESDLEAYAAGLLDDRERRAIEQCARHDLRVAARLRRCPPQPHGQTSRPEPARRLKREPSAARRPRR